MREKITTTREAKIKLTERNQIPDKFSYLEAKQIKSYIW